MSEAHEPGVRSPLALAMGRFWRQHAAKAGCGIVAFFVLVAIYAPLISSETAILWADAEGLSAPIFFDLFNRNSYGSPHDLLFNLLIVLLPLVVLGWWLAGRRGWSAGRRLWVSLGLVVASFLLCQIPLIPKESGWQAIWDERPFPEETIMAYRDQAAGEEAEGARAWALFPAIPHRYDRPFYSLRAPFVVNPDTGSRFLLGTDSTGHDVFTRMLFGARISLTIGLVATGLSLIIGTIIGAISAYFGGRVDLVLQRLVEIMMTFPVFILLLLVVAMIGRDIYIIMIVIGLTGWAGTARLVRGEFLAQQQREYVLCGQAMGLPKWRIMFLHILPNALTPLLISASFAIAGTILLESALAFIGLGDPTAPSWGAILDMGRRNFEYVWLIWVPGLAIFALVSSLNLIGNAMREALDPKGAR